MGASLRTVILAAGAIALGAARPPAAPNPLTVVVANGPYAGTYHAKADEVVCLHAKAQRMFAASFKDFDAPTARSFAEGGLKVANPDAPGAKTGQIYVAFGTKDKKAVEYDIPNAPITMTVKGKGVDLMGTAKSKDGVLIRVNASCVDISTM